MPSPKIQIPRVSRWAIPRPHLVESVGRGCAAEGGATLVCAPAGYGKSTLLSQCANWLQQHGAAVGWMSCDHYDSTSALLWRGIVEALSAGFRRVQASPEMIDPFSCLTPPTSMDRPFLTDLTRAIDDLDIPMVLVLDDFHEVTDPVVLEELTDLVRNLPEQCHLIIGSRRDPAIALHRLRMEGRLREVRGADLSFAGDEVEQVLHGQGVQLDQSDLLLLCCRTEGWPAAVRLAALALAQNPDPSRFVARFAGDNTAVAGYLVAEILSRQSPEQQQFLLDTCVAEELTAELAATLSGRPDAGAVLDLLEHTNALVQRVGRAGEWFRYHALLRSYLLAELRRRDLAATADRHRSAARWFEASGAPASALEHAVLAADADLIIDLLAGHGLRLVVTGQGEVVARAIAGSPRLVRESPDVELLTAIIAFRSGDRDGGDDALARFRLRTSSDQSGRRLTSAAYLYQARLHGDTEFLEGLGAGRARPGTPIDDEVALLELVNVGALRIAAGEYRRAQEDLQMALELSVRRECPHLALECMNQLTGVTGGLSQVAETRQWAQRTVEFAGKHGWSSSPQLAYTYALSAWSSYLMLELDQATRTAGAALAVLEGGTIDPEAECAARSAASVIEFDRPERRRAALRSMDEVWRRLDGFTPSPALTAFAHLTEVRMCLAHGDRARAAAVSDRVERMLPGTGDAAVVAALTRLAHGHDDHAASLVAPVLGKCVPEIVVTTGLTAHLVEAIVARRAHRTESAHRSLLAALEIGNAHGLLRPFYDSGTPVHELLLTAVGRTSRLEPFLSRLLTAWKAAETWRDGMHAGAPSVSSGAAPPTVPLTAREIEVLHELPSLLTAEEIAEQHQVSVNTVKTHLRALYRKLGATNRRDAVAHARRVGLL